MFIQSKERKKEMKKPNKNVITSMEHTKIKPNNQFFFLLLLLHDNLGHDGETKKMRKFCGKKKEKLSSHIQIIIVSKFPLVS